MRIALLAAGSRGDYLPLLAVGQSLVARGHEIGVTATSEFADLVQDSGLQVEPVDVDAMALYHRGLAEHGAAPSFAAQAARLQRLGEQMAPAVAATMREVWPRYHAVVATAMSTSWAGLASIGDPRPLVQLMFVPVVPSIRGDMSMFSTRPGRSLANLTTGLRATASAMRLVRPSPAQLDRFGLSRRDGWQIVRRIMTAPVVVANTPVVIAAGRVGGRRLRPVGYPFYDRLGAQLPRPVVEFLATGPPPVYVGLGSHMLPQMRTGVQHAVQAAREAGFRVVLQHGSGAEQEVPAGDDLLVIDAAPHELLFGQVAAVVHHGGAGTVAQALRAGAPQVVVPVMVDQPFFARRVHELGVAGPPVPLPEAAGPDGTAAIRAALAAALTEPTHARAAVLADRLRREDGATGAAEEIERILGA
ncbi:glycosyltransferase [Ruania albidiflava]|uniref:glycosyltransferase n=1 Tax=Ruania albidiflava TaxID=366586 RepID=UPI0003B5BE31|nr:glycosyltransferase [Ruania albidiflava]